MIKKLKVLLILTIGATMIFNFLGCKTSSEYNKIDTKTAKHMMDTQNATILDVREDYEYREGHIKNAILLPLGQIDKNANEIIKDKNTTILVYCRSGNRSKTATLKLIDLGYKNVYDFGGIIDWEYEIVKP